MPYIAQKLFSCQVEPLEFEMNMHERPPPSINFTQTGSLLQKCLDRNTSSIKK